MLIKKEHTKLRALEPIDYRKVADNHNQSTYVTGCDATKKEINWHSTLETAFISIFGIFPQFWLQRFVVNGLEHDNPDF
jgi:hypothetical protein